MAISDADFHEREANNRAYHRNVVEMKKVEATREQIAELRALRRTLERILAVLPSEAVDE